MLGVGVEGHRSVELVGDELRDQRDPRRSPTSNTTSIRLGVTPADRSARFVTTTVSPSNGRIIDSNSARVSRTRVCAPGSRTGMDTSVSLDKASGTHALVVQACHRELCDRVVEVERSDRVADRTSDVAKHCLVEVDAAESFDALRFAQQLEAGGRGAQNRHVERAATEVVHRNR